MLLNELRLAPQCFIYALEALRDEDRRERAHLEGEEESWDAVGWHGLQYGDIYPYPEDARGRAQSANVVVNGVIHSLQRQWHADVLEAINLRAAQQRIELGQEMDIALVWEDGLSLAARKMCMDLAESAENRVLTAELDNEG